MRRTGAAFFLGDAAFLSDARFRQLARRLTEPDDFNSAVGAWFIALAAARRNGRPELDVETETGSRFVEDLRAVGLLTDSGFRSEPFEAWRPMAPQQAAAGRARAATATRTDAGTFTSALAPLDALDQRAPASIPLPSYPINSTEERLQGEKPDPWEAFRARTGQVPGPKLRDWLNDLGAQFGDRAVVAAIAGTALEGRPAPAYLAGIKDRLAVAAHKAERVEEAGEQAKRTANRFAPMLARREELYRQTGQWEEAWGPKPDGATA